MALNIKNRLFSRQQPGNADPAHAFGSQEQLMAEFRNQQYVQPPQEAPRTAAEIAGAALASLRDRFVRPAREYDTGAPTYSADTYDQPSAPDLGWAAAFDPGAVRQESPAAPPAPTAQQRFETFRDTVYSSPLPRQYGQPYAGRPAPVYEEISFTAPPRREAPVSRPAYEELRFTAPPQRENNYQKPVYEELDLTGNRSRPAPAQSVPPVQPDTVPGQTYPEQGMYEAPPISPDAPDRPRTAPASDFQYFFWSVSILTGAVLTVFSFIYACVV